MLPSAIIRRKLAALADQLAVDRPLAPGQEVAAAVEVAAVGQAAASAVLPVLALVRGPAWVSESPDTNTPTAKARGLRLRLRETNDHTDGQSSSPALPKPRLTLKRIAKLEVPRCWWSNAETERNFRPLAFIDK
jgi:hypothetical protein